MPIHPETLKRILGQGATFLVEMPPTSPPLIMQGPGTEMKKLLTSIGINSMSGCSCDQKIVQMDVWGPHGCNDHRLEIIGWMKDSATKLGWLDGLKAAALAVKTGLTFRLNPLDPFPGLVDEAIRRATL